VSDLFEIRVLAVAGATARFHVETVHPDQYDVPASKNFALQLIVEAYWVMGKGYLHGKQPFLPTEAAARVAAHPRGRELAALVELKHGKDIVITEAEYEALRRDHDRMRAEGISSCGGATVDGRMIYSKNRGPAYRGFIHHAERDVVEVSLADERNNPRPSDDAPDASATVIVTVRDAALLAHLAPGLHWASAMYDFHGWEQYDATGAGLPS